MGPVMPGSVEARLRGILEHPALQQDGDVLQGELAQSIQTLLERPANREGVVNFVGGLLDAELPQDRFLAVTLIGDTKLTEFRSRLESASSSEAGVRTLFGLDPFHNLSVGYPYRALLSRTISNLSPSTPPSAA